MKRKWIPITILIVGLVIACFIVFFPKLNNRQQVASPVSSNIKEDTITSPQSETNSKAELQRFLERKGLTGDAIFNAKIEKYKYDDSEVQFVTYFEGSQHTKKYIPIIINNEGGPMTISDRTFSTDYGASGSMEFGYDVDLKLYYEIGVIRNENTTHHFDCSKQYFRISTTSIQESKKIQYVADNEECSIEKTLFPEGITTVTMDQAYEFLLEKNSDVSVFADNTGFEPMKDYLFFSLFSTPAGPSGDEYIPLYVFDKHLHIADHSFVTTALVGIWGSFGYLKGEDVFYEIGGTPSSWTEEKGIPCSFTKYRWDMNQLKFIQIDQKNFYSKDENDGFCTKEFASYGIHR